MAFRYSQRLGASVLAAALLALPVSLIATEAVFAENSESGLPSSNKKKKSQQPLGAAAVSGKVVTATEVVASKNIAPMLTAESVQLLRNSIERYRQIASQGGFPKVPKGTYKKGGESKGIAALNKRLFMEGYLRPEATQGEFAPRMTSATIDGLTRFQRNMGLAATGGMDGPTLAAMNVPVEQRIRTMEANIARLEAYGQNLGDRYLVVNVPSQQIETVQGGRVYSRHNAIVGRPERPTPVVMTALSDINFNPYWNTPPSIIERDLFPKMRSGTQILEDMNIRVFEGFGGPEVDPDSVDWSSAVADNYHFRQEPGPTNAMATAKINFPSPFGIYLHDTPEKHLFKSGQRYYSSGCVRVEKVDMLLQWILNGQDGIGSSEIAGLAETLERRDVKLTAAPQLRVTYLTAWPVGNTVAFRPDVYDLDGTGFTVGQPMPVGEVADDGQRFVLKPIPRKASAVDADEAEGFGLFGGRLSGKGKARPKISNDLYGGNDDGFVDVDNISSRRKVGNAEGKLLVGKKPVGVKSASLAPAKPVKKKVGKAGRDVPGLFDWAAYRKEQKYGIKKDDASSLKKKAKPKPDKLKAETLKSKKPADKKLAAKADDDKSSDKTKAKVAKKLDDKETKKVAAVEPKATAKSADKVKAPVEAKAKKPATEPKKLADKCKPDAAGKLAAGCKPTDAKKP